MKAHKGLPDLPGVLGGVLVGVLGNHDVIERY